MRRIRIGIDVGGTFTDFVALDQTSGEVLCQLKVPTTLTAREGVAAGILEALNRARDELHLQPGEVAFIAHSTTQATNALLEGDVAPVGILAMASRSAWLARRAARLKRIELAPGRAIEPQFRFLRTDGANTDTAMWAAIESLAAGGARVIVATEAFAVDAPANEKKAVEIARAQGLQATAGHEVSQLYGLRPRTRTAVVNACILPRMLETAEMTARSVAQAGITAPLMVMRSDGGVMAVDEVRRRPILTILSGPAAGVAGALLYEKVSTGIFLEFGGTSTDISVIREGRAVMKPARIGGHRTYLTTLDVRTVGIGGGSMAAVEGNRIARVGPRSAHIAGLPYSCFEPMAAPEADRAQVAGDPAAYLAVREGERRAAVTTTCAANALGIVPEGNYARGEQARATAAIEAAARPLGLAAAAAARRILELASEKVVATCEELIREYRLERGHIELVGGGGAAGALLPFIAERMRLPFRIARRAEVISCIGVALAMVREAVERNVADPTADDVLRIRREAEQAVLKQGALPGTIEVEVQVDRQRHLVHAVAVGATEIRGKAAADAAAVDLAAVARRFIGDAAQPAGETARFILFAAGKSAAAVDRDGVVRFQARNCRIESATAADVKSRLAAAIDRYASYGDAGRLLPSVHLLWGGRLLDLSSLADDAQVLALADVELGGLAGSEPVYILVQER